MDCENNIQGNLSTIILFIYILIAPYLEAFGISQSLFAEFAFAVIGLVIAVWSAYNPNTFKIFGNHKRCACKLDADDVEDDYELDDEGC